MPSYLLGPPPACGYDAIPNFHTVLLHYYITALQYYSILWSLGASVAFCFNALISREEGIDEWVMVKVMHRDALHCTRSTSSLPPTAACLSLACPSKSWFRTPHKRASSAHLTPSCQEKCLSDSESGSPHQPCGARFLSICHSLIYDIHGNGIMAWWNLQTSHLYTGRVWIGKFMKSYAIFIHRFRRQWGDLLHMCAHDAICWPFRK